METEKVLSMNGGQGEYSYAQNSNLVQKKILLSAKPPLEESIRSWKNTFNCETLCIADLGCSSGPNTLFITEIIAKEIQNKYINQGMRVPEFQVFYNDLPSNDFNSLFRLLLAEERACNMAAGVPGSFYTRLFPLNSLHFIHSSFGLHWLARVPAEVEDKNSKGWNRGRVFISEEGSESVADAYFAQFQRDLNAFLKARANEMVVGGRMFLLCFSRSSADKIKHADILIETIECAMIQLVSQGMIEEEKLDSFNFPVYYPNIEEVRSEVYKEGSFSIVRLQSFATKLDGDCDNDKEANARLISKQARAVFEALISNHFGEGVVNDLFQAHITLLENNMEEIMESWNQPQHMMALTLERSCV